MQAMDSLLDIFRIKELITLDGNGAIIKVLTLAQMMMHRTFMSVLVRYWHKSTI